MNTIAIRNEETVKFSFRDEVTSFLSELTSDGSKRLLEIVNGLFNLPDSFGKLFRIQSDVCPTDARKVTVTCKPTDFLRELGATFRTGETDLPVPKINHNSPPAIVATDGKNINAETQVLCQKLQTVLKTSGLIWQNEPPWVVQQLAEEILQVIFPDSFHFQSTHTSNAYANCRKLSAAFIRPS